MKEIKTFNYIPASIVPKNNEFNWWGGNNNFKYNYILINAFHYLNTKFPFDFPKDMVIIGDSGGFQNMTQGAEMDVLKVLRWQEKYCTIGMTFDKPILLSDNENIRKLKQYDTTINAYKALDNRKNNNLKLYAVFHGHNYIELQNQLNIYKEKGDLNKFDGFAIGGIVPLASNPEQITLISLIFIDLIKSYKKPLHFFGTGGGGYGIIYNLLKEIHTNNITADSIYFANNGLYMQMLEGNSLKNIKVDSKNLNSKWCNCDICKNYSLDDIKNKEGPSIIILHNLYHIVKHNENLKNIDENILYEYCKIYYPKFLISLDIINYYKKYGLNDTLIKYQNFKLNPSLNKKSKSLNYY